MSRESKNRRSAVSARWSVKRAEKVSAIEGLHLSERMARTFKVASEKGMSGDDTRALIRSKFARKPA